MMDWFFEREKFVLNKNMTIRVNDDFLEKLDYIVMATGRTNKSDIIREALTRYYNQNYKFMKSEKPKVIKEKILVK